MPEHLPARVTPAINHGSASAYRKGCRCDDCKLAKAEENALYKAKNADKLRTYDRAYYDRTRDYQSRRFRDRKLRTKYGLDTQKYQELLDFQSSRCYLCLRTAEQAHPGGDPLCVDHDHETGAVRGLLCYTCNTQLGWAENGKWSITANQAEYLSYPPYSLWVAA